jgi:hypothetical protein
MNTRRRALALALALGLSLAGRASRAAVLVLEEDFVERHMNRATIRVNLRVDVHPKGPHGIKRGSDDGDIHMAGRSADVRLPLVAEIMNARSFQAVLDALKQTSSNVPVEVHGVWRVWFEHPGKGMQIQGATVPKPATSNPDHVFEIHPLTRFDGLDLRQSLVRIAFEEKQFEAHEAQRAFGQYEKLKARLSATDEGIHIDTRQAGFNYVEFFLEPVGEVETRQDALFVLAHAYDISDLETPVTAAPRRMVFVRGSPPARALEELSEGNLLHVLGEPRVNLREVMEILEGADGEVMQVALPYEMVIVGIYPDEE